MTDRCRADLQAMQEGMRLREEVKRINEDDGHAARIQVPQPMEQVQNNHVPRNERARKCRLLERLHRCFERPQCTLLHQ